MKNLSKGNRRLLLSLLSKRLIEILIIVILFGIISLPEAASPPLNVKADFLAAVRDQIEDTHRTMGPLTSNCFALADTNRFCLEL